MKKDIVVLKKWKKNNLLWILLGMLLLSGCGSEISEYSDELLTEIETVVDEYASGNDAPDSDRKGNELQVHFIDVGQGDATLISCDGEHMLIDGGDNSKGTTVQYYLQSKGVEELKYVVGTHPDADHVGGLDVVISKFDCETILLTGEERDTDTYQDVLDAMEYRGYEMTVPVPGEEFTLGDATFTVEGPLVFSSDSNDNSIVIHLEHGENSFLFSGDAGEEEELDILSTGRDISADVYKVGHHGSKTSTCEMFLQTIDPVYAVISVGEDNKYGHPAAEVLNRLRMHGVEVFRTDEQGGIIAVSDGETITWSSSPSESWQAGEPEGSAESDSGVVNNTVSDTNAQSVNSGVVASALGEAEVSDKIVHITETGTKYHAAGCKHLKSDIEIELNKAIAEGYEPCKVCGGGH